MYAVIVNAATIVAGAFIGMMLRGGIPVRFQKTIQRGIDLCVMAIGIAGVIKTQNFLLMILCVVIGSALGELMRIEDGLIYLGERAQKRFAKGDSMFAQSFISSTLLFCVGAMAIVGSLEAGLTGKVDTLLAKSVLDGVSSIIFASTLGPGVALSAVPLIIYQGGIALMSGTIQPLLSGAVINEMSAIGSVLIIGMSLNMLGVMNERIKVGNMLPALLLPMAIAPLMDLIQGLFK